MGSKNSKTKESVKYSEILYLIRTEDYTKLRKFSDKIVENKICIIDIPDVNNLLNHYGGRYCDNIKKTNDLESLFYECLRTDDYNHEITILFADLLNMYRGPVLTNLILHDAPQRLIHHFTKKVTGKDRRNPISAAIMKKNNDLVLSLSNDGDNLTNFHAYYMIMYDLDLDIDISEKVQRSLYSALRKDKTNIGYDHYPEDTKLKNKWLSDENRKKNALKILKFLDEGLREGAINSCRKLIERDVEFVKKIMPDATLEGLNKKFDILNELAFHDFEE